MDWSQINKIVWLSVFPGVSGYLAEFEGGVAVLELGVITEA